MEEIKFIIKPIKKLEVDEKEKTSLSQFVSKELGADNYKQLKPKLDKEILDRPEDALDFEILFNVIEFIENHPELTQIALDLLIRISLKLRAKYKKHKITLKNKKGKDLNLPAKENEIKKYLEN